MIFLRVLAAKTLGLVTTMPAMVGVALSLPIVSNGANERARTATRER